MFFKVYSIILDVSLADSLDLPEPSKTELKGLYRVTLQTPFPQFGTNFFFASYMTLEQLNTGKLEQNRFVEDVTPEELQYRRERSVK
jgi:hypothetical protein